MGSSNSSLNTYPGQRSASFTNRSSTSRVRQAYTQRPQPSSSTTTTTTTSRPSTRQQSQSQQQQQQQQQQPISANTISQPGAYSISRNNNNSNNNTTNEVFRVAIPPNIQPNDEFQVYAGNRIVRVRCPLNARTGQYVQITLPPEDIITNHSLLNNVAVLTSAEDDFIGGGAVRMNTETRRMNNNSSTTTTNDTTTNSASTYNNESQQQPSQQQQQQQPQYQAYNVRVPNHAQPGETFAVSVNGRTIQVQCPQNARPGMTVQIRIPIPQQQSPPQQQLPPNGIQRATNLNRPPELLSSTTTNNNHNNSNNNTTRNRTVNQMFEVIVPPGVRPNQPFSLMAGGQRVLVNCPLDARPGSRIRFQIPMSIPEDNNNNNSSLISDDDDSNKNTLMQGVALKYDTQDGWVRTVRVHDMKFTWIKVDENGDIITSQMSYDSNNSSSSNIGGQVFDIHNSAFVRNLQFLEGNDKRMRTGKLTLVPASDYSVASNVYANGKKVVDCSELSRIQTRGFNEKAEWFLRTCKTLGIPWEEGHMRIVVRREQLLSDSIKAVMSLGREDLRKIWRFDFMGETGIDAGGLAKEWFHEVTRSIFDADSGLWVSSEGNQMHMRINPASKVSCPQDHLIYFRFLGRVLGKALFEGQLVAGHMVQYLYKYMLGWPITFNDIESIDVEIYKNLKKCLEIDRDQVEYLCLDFTTTQHLLGETTEVELVPEGKDKAVTGDNLGEYVEVYFKYLLLERIRPQVTELLLGFYDVVPEPMLSIFDFQELELMMCGLPSIDLDDWVKHTQYTGSFAAKKSKNQVCNWFWEVVRDEFDQEMKARLLQFATGTSGVPSRGFSVLQGSDGNIKLFTLNGVDDMDTSSYPRSQ